jgi:hypothetical protein
MKNLRLLFLLCLSGCEGNDDHDIVILLVLVVAGVIWMIYNNKKGYGKRAT